MILNEETKLVVSRGCDQYDKVGYEVLVKILSTDADILGCAPVSEEVYLLDNCYIMFVKPIDRGRHGF